MEDTKVYVGQKAFIEKRGKVLLIQDYPTLIWDFPGGKLRWSENLKDSLIREVREETNLKINVNEPFWSWKYQVKAESSKSFG